MSRIVASFISEALRPPSPLPMVEWAEANISLDHSSDIPGRLQMEFYPQSRAFVTHAWARRTRRLVAICAAQSAKTSSCLFVLMRYIVENPRPVIWYVATMESAKDFAKRKLFPMILDCPPVFRLSPTERDEWTGKLVQFASMNLLIRGAESKLDLQGAEAGVIICDERREWKPGRIQMARKRLTSFRSGKEISIGTAGMVGGELHNDFTDGSQGFFHFACPACQHVQPFRFGRKKSPWHPEPRERGGIVFKFDDDRTKGADGEYDLDLVRKFARYECESCGHHMGNSDKPALLKTVREVHRNTRALPEYPSLTWGAMMLNLPATEFGEIAVEFIRAKQLLKATGDTEALQAFVTETLGEPWKQHVESVSDKDILSRQGDYFSGEAWPHEKGRTCHVLAMDRQQGYLMFTHRQWRRGGQSRLIRCGNFQGIEEARLYQLEHKIEHVIGDDGGPNNSTDGVVEWRTACARYGWHSFKGEGRAELFSRGDDGSPVRSFWKQSSCIVGQGSLTGKQAEIPLWLWCVPHYKMKLYQVFLRGQGPLYEIPRDVPTQYLRQLQANELRSRPLRDGSTEFFYFETGPDHFADCELMGLAFADVSGIIRLMQPESPKAG